MLTRDEILESLKNNLEQIIKEKEALKLGGYNIEFHKGAEYAYREAIWLCNSNCNRIGGYAND